MAQVVLITGTSAGIGKVTAERLAQLGYRVFGASLEPDVPVQGVQTLFIDVTDPDSVTAGVQSVLQQVGQIDILINNAGIVGVVGGPEEISREQWRRVLDTNLMGMIEMVKAVLPGMRERRAGMIVNMSSVGGVVPLPYYFAPYITSKHAIEGFTQILRGEVKPFGIRVALVAPSAMKTQLDAGIAQPAAPIADYTPYRQRAYDMQKYLLERGRDPSVVADAVVSVLQNPNPPLRTPAGKEAEIIVPLSRPIPHRYPEVVFDWLFLSRRPWQPEREPLKRLFMDPPYADDIQRKSRWLLLIVPLLLLLGWHRSRSS